MLRLGNRLFFLLRVAFNPPVLLYQMGKVGSSSLRATLEDVYPGYVLHAHHPEMLSKKTLWLLKFRRALGLRVFVVSPIRDPVSRNISAFFQNFEKVNKKKFNQNDWDVSGLKSLYLEKYWHDEVGNWFDESFKPVFGLDVYKTNFDKNNKYTTYEKGVYKVLVYRSDMDRDDQLNVVSRFLGFPLRKWCITNVSSKKAYGKHYQDFRNLVRFSPEYVDRLVQTKFCKHFWSDDERNKMQDRWVSGND